MGQAKGEVRSQSDNKIITSGKIQTTGSTALVQSNGTYIMFLGPADYTLSTDIAGYINESQEISVTAGAVLTGIDFILSPPDTDADGDGYTIGEGDCDDGNPNIHPGASDANCDGIDQNCINGPDDGYVNDPTFCGVGACSAIGQWECQSGSEVNICTPGSPTDEICGDEIDQDCDGEDLICLSDSDEDGLPDDWEQYYFSNLNETGSGDPDQDGFVNLQEFQCGSDPVDPYSKCLKTLPWLILLM
jgi:hypothetical protein